MSTYEKKEKPPVQEIYRIAGKNNPAGMLSDVSIKKCFGVDSCGNNKGINIYDDRDTLRAIDGNPEYLFSFDKQVKEASADLRIDPVYRCFKNGISEVEFNSKLQECDYSNCCEGSFGSKILIKPHEVIIAKTLETVALGKQFVAFVHGRQSLARLGVLIHCGADFIHPGYTGKIPLQIVNLSNREIWIDPKEAVCQITFFMMNEPSSVAYNERPGARYSQEMQEINEESNSKGHKMSGGNSSKRNSKEIPLEFATSIVIPILITIACTLFIVPILQTVFFDMKLGDVFARMLSTPMTIIFGVLSFLAAIGIFFFTAIKKTVGRKR